METILIINLKKEEEALIKGLIASFELKTESVETVHSKNFEHILSRKNICMVILKVDDMQRKQAKKIRYIKKRLLRPVPIFILIPQAHKSSIHKYMKAGADDYSLIPLNEDAFSIRFYVLLECGQAILQNMVDGDYHTPPSPDDKDTLKRIFTYLQEGLNYFSPKSQIRRKNTRRIFNKWEQIRKLGSGGDGSVWLVQESRSSARAVAKIPHSRELNISSLRAAAILKRLIHHPNVVHLIEVIKEEEKFILLQEYINGKTLPEHLESGCSSGWKEAVFLQLLSVTAYAHNHKIMHRDIKPDNIMVTPGGRVKLLDFGLAKETAWENDKKDTEGTLSFMPPEQFKGKSCLASDVYTLGIILYLFCAKRLPFYRGNTHYPMDLNPEVTILPPGKFNSEIIPALEQIIMRCLENDLEKRYPNASELQNEVLTLFPEFGNGLTIPS